MLAGQNEWAMWANEHAYISGIVMLMGGIVGCIGFDGLPFAIYTIVAGTFVCLLEYPRSMRRKGSTVERRFQSFLHPFILCGSPVTTNYFVRFVVYLILCVPCAFQLPTLIGGICLLIAGLIYFKAALGGESWKGSTEKDQKRKMTITIGPPANPPPRPPVQTAATNGADNNGFTIEENLA